MISMQTVKNIIYTRQDHTIINIHDQNQDRSNY